MPKKDSRLAKYGEMIKRELEDEDFEPDFGLFYSIHRICSFYGYSVTPRAVKRAESLLLISDTLY